MVIKKLVVKNFRSYFGEKVFEFGEHLNLILGANGDGKTTFYDALDFVFNENSTEQNSQLLSTFVSEKMFQSLSEGQTGEVGVYVELLNDDRKSRFIERTFQVEKKADGAKRCFNHGYDGYIALPNGMRKRADRVRTLLESEMLFPALIRKYSLFKGESSLNVFDDKTTLKNLIDMFSDIKDLEPYKNFLDFAKESSSNAFAAAQRKNKTNNDKQKALQNDLAKLKKRQQELEDRLKELLTRYKEYNEKISDWDADKELLEVVHNKREAIRLLETEMEVLKDKLDENYPIYLLDKLWILEGFSPILDKYAEKMHELSEQKSVLEELNKNQYNKRVAEAEAEEKALQKLKDEISGLPWYVPDVHTMESMLKKQQCALCGSPAPEGSDAYKHIEQHLQVALDHIFREKENKKAMAETYVPMFSQRNIDRIHESSTYLYNTIGEIENISYQINELIEQNEKVNNEIFGKNQKIDQLKTEIARIQAQSKNGHDLGSNDNSWVDYKHAYDSRERVSNEITSLKESLLPRIKTQIVETNTELKKSIGNASAQEFFLINDFVTRLRSAVDNAEEQSLEDFMSKLSDIANDYLSMLNVDDFTGVVKMHKNMYDDIVVELVGDNGRRIDKPNTSLNTTMHLSILFAISTLAEQNLNTRSAYPIILDAPTSSFDEGKDKTFYQVMNEKLNRQCIIVTKSYLYKENNDFVADTAALDRLMAIKKIPVYRIKKLEGFKKTDLSTIETVVEPLF